MRPSEPGPIVEVMGICAAYESGFGHAYDDLVNPYEVGSKEYNAYQIGKTKGVGRKVVPEHPAPRPEGVEELRKRATHFIDQMLPDLIHEDQPEREKWIDNLTREFAAYRTLEARPGVTVTVEEVRDILYRFTNRIEWRSEMGMMGGFTDALNARLALTPAKEVICECGHPDYMHGNGCSHGWCTCPKDKHEVTPAMRPGNQHNGEDV